MYAADSDNICKTCSKIDWINLLTKVFHHDKGDTLQRLSNSFSHFIV